MGNVCLIDALWTDPRCLYLRKRKRRLWQLLVDMERLRSRWHPDDVAEWSEAVWAANLDVTERRFGLDLAELRALGLVDPERIALRFCREAASEERTARPQYASDDPELRRQKRMEKAAAVPLVESTTTPQSLRNDSTNTPPSTPPDPTVTVTVPFNGYRSVSLEKNGNGSVTENGTGVPPPPPGLRERMLATGMQERDVSDRLARFDSNRIEEALAELAYRNQRKPVGKPDGFIAKFLDGGWQASRGAMEEQRREKQGRLPLLTMTTPPGAQRAPARPPGERAEPEFYKPDGTFFAGLKSGLKRGADDHGTRGAAQA